MRREQAMEGFLWYAAYDEDIYEQAFALIIDKSKEKWTPLESRNLKIEGFEVFSEG